MGRTITSWLEDPAIVEIMPNPGDRLWIDRLTAGLSETGKRLSAEDGAAPALAIRKPAVAIFTLADYARTCFWPGRGAERQLVELAVVKGLTPVGDFVLAPAVKPNANGGRS